MKLSSSLIVTTLLIISQHSAHSFVQKESFEGDIPNYIVAQNSELRTTSKRVQDGKQALRWDYKNGGTVSFKCGALGNVNVWTGYGNYSRSSFTLRVYLPKVSDGKLVVEFLAKGEVAGHYDIPLQHKGWQQIVHHYSWHTNIKWTKRNLQKSLDEVRIHAVTTTDSYAIFDAIEFNKPRDFRDARQPVVKHWQPAIGDFSKTPQPTTEDLKKLAALEYRLSSHPNPKIKDDHWQRRIDTFQKRVKSEGFTPGNSIKKNLGYYFGILNSIANDCCRCANPKYKAELATLFINMNSWMQEQGLVVQGATGKANNYIGRTYVDAIAKMRDPLADAKQLTTALNFIKWSYGYDYVFFPSGKPNYQKSMDYFHNEALRLLHTALMHKDPIVRWHHVALFRNILSNQLVRTIKPDGSLFHHGMHYFAYGVMGINSISGTLALLSDVGLPVTEQALDAAKLGAMQMRWYAGGRIILLSLCGRHPSGTQALPNGAFYNIAKAYAPYNHGKVDEELARAYLRFEPQKSNKPPFTNIQPETAPQGFVTMPYAGLGLHRRENWLAGVKGFSSFVSSMESYANANRFGLYLSNGYLELLTHPLNSPTVHGSGIRPNQGFNWLALDGTTAIHSTLKNIANGNGSFHEKSGGNFNGGLSHDGRNGMFVQQIASNTQPQKSRTKGVKGTPFTAIKSWFFFDNRIICLGSNISLKKVDFPVRTTLFQKFITNDYNTTTANEESLTLQKEIITRNYNNKQTTLVDPYGNAYFIANSSNIKLTIGEQKSRDGYDKKDTAGNYATAWIEHGKNPQDAKYNYAILVQPKTQEINYFTKKLANSATAPYQILQQNKQGHIVYDNETNTTAYAIFEKGLKLPPTANSPLLIANLPCLIMVEKKAESYLISITNPDPRNDKNEPVFCKIALKGKFTESEKMPLGVSIKIKKDAYTIITTPILHGESATLKLKKVK